MNYRMGVDVGGTTIKFGILDEENNIVIKSAIDTPDTFEKSMKELAGEAERLAGELGLTLKDFPCIGVGTPGSVNSATGWVALSGNTNWKDVYLKAELEKYIPVPVYIGNDANCAIIGENVAGAAKGRKNVLMFTLGTGVGGGIILNGKMFSGADGLGAEVGHVVMIHNGLQCACGMKGCMECYASATALVRQTEQAAEEHPESIMNDWIKEHGKVSGRTAFECARKNDKAALEVVNNYTAYIANGIGSMVNVFRPEIVIIGGGVSNEGEYLLELIREKAAQYTFAQDVIGIPDIVRASLGNDAGMIGAAYLDCML